MGRAPDGSIAPRTPVGYDGIEPWALLRGLIDDFEVQHEDDFLVLPMCWAAPL